METLNWLETHKFKKLMHEKQYLKITVSLESIKKEDINV